MDICAKVLVAFGADLIIGDPAWFFHPVRMIGNLAAWTETLTRRGFADERIAGAAAFLTVIFISLVSTFVLLKSAQAVSLYLSGIISVWLLYSCLAARDLYDHAMRVKAALDKADIFGARAAVSMIVGRDTENMDEPEICRAAVESVAENLTDGVIGPLLAMIFFGPVGAIAFKTINTLDSMFGYKNEKYKRFGTWAARADDVMVWLPARFALFCLVTAARLCGKNGARAFKTAVLEHAKHASPNSGWGEAAMAGALEIRLGGDSVYEGKRVNRPVINGNARKPGSGDIMASCRLMLVSSFVCLGFGLLIRCFIAWV